MKRVVVFVLLLGAGESGAMEASGLLAGGLSWSDSERSWLRDGLDKQRFDDGNQPLQLDQAVLELRQDLADTVAFTGLVNAYTDRDDLVDLVEAYVRWRPVPVSAWRWKARAGEFILPVSLENTGTGWSSPLMLSSSAIDTWIGEEIRTLGAEATAQYDGKAAGSPHNWGFSLGSASGADAAGSLLAWRGWAIGDRVSGISERLPLPANLPAFAPGSDFEEQGVGVEPFHEIDDRTGYYVHAQYGFTDRFVLRAMHYDNRGDPAAETGGQYAWYLKFNAVGMRWSITDNWLLMSQYLEGDSEAGDELDSRVLMDYSAVYGLLSWHQGRHRVSFRYDGFWAHDLDHNPEDPNKEYGHGYAVAYLFDLRKGVQLGVEALRIESYREARELIGEEERWGEKSLRASLRWSF